MKIAQSLHFALLLVMTIGGIGCNGIPTYRPDEYPVSATTTGTAPVQAQPPVQPVADASGTQSPTQPGLDTITVGQKLVVIFGDTPTQYLPMDVTVREDGTITLMFDREFKAAGRTRGELEKEIRAAYVPSYFRQLTVTIRAEERFFTVGGEVRVPGRQIYSGSLTVLQGIAASGGFTEFANKRKVEIIRANKAKDTVDCIEAQKNPQLNLPIYPNDQIHVPRRGF